MSDPRHTHNVDQLQAGLREMGRSLATYREELMDAGMDEAEAWALVQRAEERWADVLFAQFQGKQEARALEGVVEWLESKIDEVTHDT